jgi:hypothetical protein
LIYRPLPAAAAARTVEEQVNAAQFRAQYRRARKLDPRARDLADHEQAVQAAREEALGAGVGRVCLFVTVTVDSEGQLGTAVADVEARAESAKIRPPAMAQPGYRLRHDTPLWNMPAAVG